MPHGDGSWDDSWFVLSARPVQLVRDAGALAVLPLALSLQAGTHIFAGQFVVAEALWEEAHAVSDAIANPDAPMPVWSSPPRVASGTRRYG
ncbi:MAG: hypothetical protein WAL38_25220 [Solirubrobacteraceae bacterium]